MRQSLKERRQHLHRGMPMPRLVTMFFMLLLTGLLIVRLHDPGLSRLFTSGNDESEVAPGPKASADGKPAPSKPVAARSSAQAVAAHASGAVPNPAVKPPEGKAASAAAAPSVPPDLTPTGPTDLDPDEMDVMKSAVSVISDGSLETRPEDMPAYLRILSWVDHQPTALLRKRAKATRTVLYDYFRTSPDVMRLQIVEVHLDVRQIVRIPDRPKGGKLGPMLSPDGKPLYEVRGFSTQDGSSLYFGLVSDLPPGMPIGSKINEDARLVGYFFKLQGYFSQQQLNDAAETGIQPTAQKAPLIIGRLIWTPPPPEESAITPPLWLAAPVGGVAIVLVLGWVYLNSRRSRRKSFLRNAMTGQIDPDAPAVDHWLDQAQSGRLPMDLLPEPAAHLEEAPSEVEFGGRLAGNIFWDNSESNKGELNNGKSKRGHGGADPDAHENGSSGTS